MIQSRYFYDLLDCLADQFLKTGTASCVGDDFGIDISSSAKEYFSVDIVPEELQNDLVVLGVLFDDSVYVPGRNGFSFTIYVDLRRFIGFEHRIYFLIILAHEICHFAFYYELFVKLGDNTGIRSHSNFTHEISSKLIGAVTSEQDNTSQTIFDEHNIEELVKTFGKYNKNHFTKGSNTLINFHAFFKNFLNSLEFKHILETYKNTTTVQP